MASIPLDPSCGQVSAIAIVEKLQGGQYGLYLDHSGHVNRLVAQQGQIVEVGDPILVAILSSPSTQGWVSPGFALACDTNLSRISV